MQSEGISPGIAALSTHPWSMEACASDFAQRCLFTLSALQITALCSLQEVKGPERFLTTAMFPIGLRPCGCKSPAWRLLLRRSQGLCMQAPLQASSLSGKTLSNNPRRLGQFELRRTAL